MESWNEDLALRASRRGSAWWCDLRGECWRVKGVKVDSTVMLEAVMVMDASSGRDGDGVGTGGAVVRIEGREGLAGTLSAVDWRGKDLHGWRVSDRMRFAGEDGGARRDMGI